MLASGGGIAEVHQHGPEQFDVLIDHGTVQEPLAQGYARGCREALVFITLPWQMFFPASCPAQAKDFLYRFHQDEQWKRLTKKQDTTLSVVGHATIRPEGPGLACLAELLVELVRKLQAIHQKQLATLDVDATIIAAHKQTALKAYEGTVGYQPQLAYWAEQGVFVVDQFRDGNVNAEYKIKEFFERAFAVLPGSVTRRRLRGDSALYNEDALTWCDDFGIEFAVSADMTQPLRHSCRAIPEHAWHTYTTVRGTRVEDLTEERQWAEVVDFIPGWQRNRSKHGQAFRYLAIRVCPRQRGLFLADQEQWRTFAVVTNMDWDGERLLRWQREKQGTVEHGHDILKNELAAGTIPCGIFGSNAAWFRLNVIVHALDTFLKVTTLPKELATAKPKRLRFLFYTIAGLVVRHARSIVLQLEANLPSSHWIANARHALLELAPRLAMT